MKKLLLIDNFDSFTFNLVHYFEGLDCVVDVVRNNAIKSLSTEHYDGIVISPGPGLPEEAGQLMDFLDKTYGTKPILGVCLGMQALLVLKGNSLYNMPYVKHGVQESVVVKRKVLFSGLDKFQPVGLYHSWAAKSLEISNIFEVTAARGEWAMAIEDSAHYAYGIQFHPESILTPNGRIILQNWLDAF